MFLSDPTRPWAKRACVYLYHLEKTNILILYKITYLYYTQKYYLVTYNYIPTSIILENKQKTKYLQNETVKNEAEIGCFEKECNQEII